MPPLKVGLAELGFYGGQLALEDRDKEVPTSASRLQKTRVNALGLALHQVKHVLDQPPRRKHLPVIGNAPFGFDQIHRLWLAISTSSLWRTATISLADHILHIHHRIADAPPECACEWVRGSRRR
jgi:hypothetical protein